MNLNFTIVGQIISFIFFVVFCMKYIWPVIISSINMRQDEIRNTLYSITDMKNKLNVRKAKIESEILIAKKNATEIINQVMKQKLEILRMAHVQANMERDRILKKTRLEVTMQYKQANLKLRKKISEIAIQIAEKIIEHSINTSKKNDIIKKIIKKI